MRIAILVPGPAYPESWDWAFDVEADALRGADCMVEKQRRLDQFQLHDAECALVIRNDVDAGISCGRRSSCQRLLSKLFCPRWSLRGERHAAEVRLHPEVAAFGALDDGVAELAVEQHEGEFAGPRNLLD